MERIGLVTLYENSYGSVLQCYATKTYLRKYNLDCELIYERARGIQRVKKVVKGATRVAYHSLMHRDFAKIRKQLKKNQKIARSAISVESRRKRDAFINSVLQPRGYERDLLTDHRFQEKFKYFIAGSDQIWNGGYLVDPFKFLDFAPDEKKIALCPSFGTDEVKKFNESSFKRYIGKFRYLSAREDAGVRIIKDITGRSAPRIPDPVMLLTRDEWNEFAIKYSYDAKPERGYVLVHFLDEPNENALNAINLLSKEYDLEVVCFAYHQKSFDTLANSKFFDGGPGDYVSLISNASFVCSDSFHTAMMSIIFNTQFYIFDRNYQHSNKQSSRLETLLSVYHAENRFIHESVNLLSDLPCDNLNFDSIRSAERQRIVDYLNSCVSTTDDDHENKITTPDLKKPDSCSGCMACAAICPKGAISFEYHEFGYRVPVVANDKCIKCRRCEAVCKDYTLTERRAYKPKAYIAFNTDNDLMIHSASGGAFSAIAKSVLEHDGIVVGSRLSFIKGKPSNEHIAITSIDELNSLLGSKYMESACINIYDVINENLKNGHVVLFCGTSCQVQAVYRYLKANGTQINTLYTIDLICHGVPGAGLFEDYISWIGKKHNGRVVDFSFRKKERGIIHYTESIRIEKGHETIEHHIPIEESPYFNMFIQYENYREHCYYCEYSQLNKPANITIGDYFEARDDYPQLFKMGGPLSGVDYINAMIVQDDKGSELIKCFGKYLTSIEVEPLTVQISHPQLNKPGVFSKFRFDGIDIYKQSGFEGLIQLNQKKVRNARLSREGRELVNKVGILLKTIKGRK